jgi:parallel beta-helix repeat protein
MYLRAGTYDNFINCLSGGDCPVTGKASNPITIATFPGDARAELRPTSASTSEVINTYQRDYWIIDSLVLDGRSLPFNSSSRIIKFDQGSDHITIQNSFLRNSPGNIMLSDSDGFHLIKNNELRSGPDLTPFGTGPYGMYGCHDCTVEFNHFHEIGGYAIHFYPSGDKNIIRHNRFKSNCATMASCAAVLVYNSANSQVYNNIVESTSGVGIQIRHGTGNKVFNNSVRANTRVGISIGSDARDAPSNTTVKNNISVDNSGSNYSDNGKATVASNNTTTGTATDHWVDAANGNYGLKSTSTAINAGTASIATGITACANGSAPDRGAVESLAPPTATVNGTALVITLENNCTTKMLPSSSVTGFTVKKKVPTIRLVQCLAPAVTPSLRH